MPKFFRSMAICLLLATLCTSSSLVLSASNSIENRHSFERDADEMMQGYVSKSNWAGNLVVAYAGTQIVRKSYGIGDRTWQIPTRPDAVYRIGSTTKMFTAIAILQLMQTGKLSLDASVRAYLPEMPEAWQPVTIKNLLAQSSGIPDYLASTDSFRALVRDDRSPEIILSLVQKQPLKFIPGSKFDYSNTNYVALGLIIEKLSGEKYSTYIDEKIFHPLRMTHSGYFDDVQVLPFLVPGYLHEQAAVRNMFYIAPSMVYAAGNLYSTIDDMLIFDHALHDGNTLGLSQENKEKMLQDYGFGYGLGTFVDKIDGEVAVGHGGTLPGYQVGYERFTRFPLTIIMMSNVYPENIDKIVAELAKLFFKYCGKNAPAEQCGLKGPD
jgi:D-alanyl-D-alanine carboxypeptidase